MSLAILIATSFSGVLGLCLVGLSEFGGPHLFSLELFVPLENSNGPTQMLSLHPSSENPQMFNQFAIDKCRKFVEDFQKALLQKGDALFLTSGQGSITSSNSLIMLGKLKTCLLLPEVALSTNKVQRRNLDKQRQMK
ncbi:uncharacterized protein HD556DRAFT_1313864 [Suillus plorans]|uniref:Uncharacterized protein n=1 Tax=Suillus plorans TaxID=116603 RepID=A0A9P7ADA6_9AGAM|nr:uncharacterized protein HD556DRAFT_1313864 [Suillus plorans]KAG1785997.1 hypothetical protein HD556DRAFT_1313864 [Suillus plorans]